MKFTLAYPVFPKSGLKPYKWQSRKDYDFLASHKFGAVPPTLPTEFYTDAGFWVPNQELTQTYSVPGFDNLTVPRMDYGCTDWMGTDMCVDQDKKLYSPLDIENITHANARGGAQLKDALEAVRKLTWAKQYYNIKAKAPIDWFTAIQLASYSAQPEVRSVGIGTPWFREFMNPQDGVLPVPASWDVQLSGATWHAWKICGWKTINGVPYLIGKPWTGAGYGDKGFCYISRHIINNLMSIHGTAAFVLSDLPPADIQTVSLSVVQNIVSFFLSLVGIH